MCSCNPVNVWWTFFLYPLVYSARVVDCCAVPGLWTRPLDCGPSLKLCTKPLDYWLGSLTVDHTLGLNCTSGLCRWTVDWALTMDLNCGPGSWTRIMDLNCGPGSWTRLWTWTVNLAPGLDYGPELWTWLLDQTMYLNCEPGSWTRLWTWTVNLAPGLDYGPQLWTWFLD